MMTEGALGSGEGEGPARRWPDGALGPAPRNAGRAAGPPPPAGPRPSRGGDGESPPERWSDGLSIMRGQTAAGTGKLGANVRKRSVAASVASLLAAMTLVA